MAADIDLLVLGDANPDLILHGGDVVPAFGQAEHLVEDARLTMGGSGAILACGAAKLGLRVAICALVGDDLFGRYVREGLEVAGVDTTGIALDETAATGVTVVLSGPDDRAIITMPGTISGLRAELIDPALLERARHVHVSSYYLQTALVPALPGIFDSMHDHGGTTSIDPNWDPSAQWDGGLLDLLHKTDVFLPNAMEATRLGHTSDLEDAVRILGSRSELVVVKNGDRGAIAGGQGQFHHVAGIGTAVVDTTGAGRLVRRRVPGVLARWRADRPCARDRQRMWRIVDPRDGRHRRAGHDGRGRRPARRRERRVIVCLAANPSIDKLFEIDRLVKGDIHRPLGLVQAAGGKGLNVARAAHALGADVIAVALLRGHAGKWLEEQLSAEGVPGAFVWAHGESRSSLSVADRETGSLTEFYEHGAVVPAAAWTELMQVASETWPLGGWLTISGSLPRGAPDDGYRDLVAEARERGNPCCGRRGRRPAAARTRSAARRGQGEPGRGARAARRADRPSRGGAVARPPSCAICPAATGTRAS